MRLPTFKKRCKTCKGTGTIEENPTCNSCGKTFEGTHDNDWRNTTGAYTGDGLWHAGCLEKGSELYSMIRDIADILTDDWTRDCPTCS